MGREAPTHLAVGQVTKPHGIRGEVFVRPLTDHPEGLYAPGVVLYPAGSRRGTPDAGRAPLTLATVRPFKDGFLVRFEGVEDRTQAEALRRTELLAPVEALAPREEGEVFFHELPGMRVEDTEGVSLGKVVEVYELEPTVLLEVLTRGGKVLIPFVADVVMEVSVEERRLVVDPPQGLLEL
ncbi:MAG TPA: ribosome maturation factor RimM [Longimicrobiales bacterium]|nr:ribosome maturation factor RimM [Longimicrobiales bacterium]